LVPAADFLRTFMDCYRTLDRLPIINGCQSDPKAWKTAAELASESGQSYLAWYYNNVSFAQS